VKKVIQSMAEQKIVYREVCKNFPLLHNEIFCIDSQFNALISTNGTLGDQMNPTPTQGGCRIGNKVFAKGICCAIHIENQQYRPQCYYTLYLVRNKGNRDQIISGKAFVMEGMTNMLPLDYIDTAKVDVIFSKKFTVRAPNAGTTTTANGVTIANPSGTFFEVAGGETYTVYSNGAKQMKFYVPLNITVQYNDGATGNPALSEIPTFHRYQWIMSAYSNYSTKSQGDTPEAQWNTYPVGHVSLSTKFKFADV